MEPLAKKSPSLNIRAMRVEWKLGHENWRSWYLGWKPGKLKKWSEEERRENGIKTRRRRRRRRENRMIMKKISRKKTGVQRGMTLWLRGSGCGRLTGKLEVSSWPERSSYREMYSEEASPSSSPQRRPQTLSLCLLFYYSRNKWEKYSEEAWSWRQRRLKCSLERNV